MIAMHGVDLHIGKLSLQLVREGVLVSFNVLLVIVPEIVGNNISSPKDRIWFHLFIDEVVHKFEGGQRQVTAERAIRRGSVCRVFRESTISSAGQNPFRTDRVGPRHVVQV